MGELYAHIIDQEIKCPSGKKSGTASDKGGETSETSILRRTTGSAGKKRRGDFVSATKR
ncbi:hypothetical protein GN958_ATG12177 [Phytophthora infestans]|uniref:Uncharacterized protein n=1 Tax=Phytophthora infestans TaxID=4787 RepID=A0A8S9UGU8_PHYIN|nr:hypothetical protein GN958_ATG12177 [Phytophthora infestans]